MANKKLPDGYARQVALQTLDIPEELFAKMIISSNGQPAEARADGLSTEAAVARNPAQNHCP